MGATRDTAPSAAPIEGIQEADRHSSESANWLNRKMKHGVSRADENRRIRQDGLREKLAADRRLEAIIRLLDMDEWPRERVNEFKAKLDANLRLLSKALPDEKAIQVTGEDGGPLTLQIVRFSDANDSTA